MCIRDRFQCAFENSGIMKDGIIYTMKTVPNYHGKQITLGDVMETGQVEEQYFIPEEKLYYTDPTVTHSDETEQRLPKEDRQTWQYPVSYTHLFLFGLINILPFSR